MKDILFVITVITVSAAGWIGSVAYDSRLDSVDRDLIREYTLIRANLSDAERRISKIERLLDGKYEERAASPVISVTPVVTKEETKILSQYVTPVSATDDTVTDRRRCAVVLKTIDPSATANDPSVVRKDTLMRTGIGPGSSVPLEVQE